MEVKAVAKHIRVSSTKVRGITNSIKGKNVAEALNILAYISKAASKVVEKVLKSAVANAQESKGVKDIDTLVIKHAFVNQGPTLKRFRPRAMGRASRIRKRTSHITVVLSDE